MDREVVQAQLKSLRLQLRNQDRDAEDDVVLEVLDSSPIGAARTERSSSLRRGSLSDAHDCSAGKEFHK